MLHISSHLISYCPPFRYPKTTNCKIKCLPLPIIYRLQCVCDMHSRTDCGAPGRSPYTSSCSSYILPRKGVPNVADFEGLRCILCMPFILWKKSRSLLSMYSIKCNLWFPQKRESILFIVDDHNTPTGISDFQGQEIWVSWQAVFLGAATKTLCNLEAVSPILSLRWMQFAVVW